MAAKTQDFANTEESYAAFHSNGTGPFMLVSRAPDSKTVFKRNPNYWGHIEGNLQAVIYTPNNSEATRTAALIAGKADFVLDPAPRDLPRLGQTSGLKIISGPENRIIFVGLDQSRKELLSGSLKCKNPLGGWPSRPNRCDGALAARQLQ